MGRIKKMQKIINKLLEEKTIAIRNEIVANEQASTATEELNKTQSELYKLQNEREDWQKYLRRISDMYFSSQDVRKRQAEEIMSLKARITELESA